MKKSALKRTLHQKPEFVVNALIEQKRSVTCCEQPTRETSISVGSTGLKEKKPNQMLGELCDGEKNMGMEYKAKIP